MTEYVSKAFTTCTGSLIEHHHEWGAIVGMIALVTSGAMLIWILWKTTSTRSRTNKSLPPLPPTGPPFSEYLAVQMEGRLTDSQQNWIQLYGRIFTVPSPLPGILPHTVVCADPAMVKELCITQTNQYRPPSRFTSRPKAFAAAVRDSVGTSLAGSVGDEWKWRRTAFVKEMHKSKLMDPNRQLLDTIFDVGEQLCAKLEQAAVEEQVVKVDILATEAAFDTILFFMFGKVLTGYDADEIRQAAKDILAYMFVSLTAPLFSFLKHVPGTKSYQATQTRNKAWKVFNDLVQDEIVQMIREAKNETPVNPQRRPGSILASWLSAEPKFYDRGLEPITAEVRGMLLAGFETTAHALAYSFGMMAEHKELSQQLHTTAKKALIRNKDKNRQEFLDESILCKNFFLEALRLYPLAPALNGECTDDIVLHYDDDDPKAGGKEYGLPKGTLVTFLNFCMQRHPQYCQGSQGPNEIEPDRWNATSPDQRPFLHTFNNGPHACPGKPLSLLEGQIFLAQVASKFDFEFPAGTDRVLYEEQLLLRPKDAMPLRVRLRSS